MWPYWLDGRAPGTVRNSFQLGSMALLTGAPICGISMPTQVLSTLQVLSNLLLTHFSSVHEKERGCLSRT